MPPNTVVVSRPSEFGNPFKLIAIGSHWSLQTLVGFGGAVWWGAKHCTPKGMDQPMARQHAVKCFEEWVNGDDSKTDLILPEGFLAKVQEKLRGKNLACWCPLDQPCHADVLLRLANAEAEQQP